MDHMRGNALKSRELLIIVIACVTSLSVSMGVRLSEFPKWDRAEMKVGDEYILATHDSYTWLAGASGLNESASKSAMALLLRFTAQALNTSPAIVAFWAPVFLASLITIPLVLWSGLIGAPVAAVLIATVGSLVPSYFTRTRLGFFDTDWASLLFPMLIGFLLAAWLRPHLHPWASKESSGASRVVSIKLPIAAILVTLLGIPWHSFIATFVIVSLWISAGLIVLGAPANRRTRLFWILGSLCGAALWGWIGAVLGIGFLLVLNKAGELPRSRWAQLLGIGLVVLLLLGLAFEESQTFLIDRIARYTDLLPSQVAAEGSGSPIAFPPSAISIAELQGSELMPTLTGMAYFWWLGAVGTALFSLLIWREPVTVLLAPLVLLGFASIQIGSRFAMFAGPVLLMAAIVPIEWLVRTRQFGRLHSRTGAVIIVALLALLAGTLISSKYYEFPAIPVVRKEHAEALIELGDIALGEGLVWTWWDYGSATQYFARLDTFADGSRNTGVFLYSLGKVLGAGDPKVSRNVIFLSAENDNRPWDVLESQGARAFDQLINSAISPELSGQNVEPQYLVATWEVIPSLSWITYYGGWDFEAMDGQLGYVGYLLQPPAIDTRTGELSVPGDPRVSLASLDVLGDDAIEHRDWDGNQSGLHLLLNSITGEAFLLDDRTYFSTAVQLLIKDPNELASNTRFELIISRDPHLRIFRVH